VIVVDPAAPAPQKFAASELAEFLRRVTGAQFAIAAKSDPSKCNLFVGAAATKLRDPNFSTDALGSDGMVVRTVGNDIILAGSDASARGTLYAVYSFLEDQVGCHWWTPSAAAIPSRPMLEVGALNVRFVPPLEYRETDSATALEGSWSARNKFNGQNHLLCGAQGGKRSYIGTDKWYCHTMWTLLPPEMYFKEHPEWYSLIDGQRRSSPNEHASLCLSNEEARRQLVMNQKLALSWHPNANMVSISQIDDAGPPERCQCDRCTAIAKEEGSFSGVMIRFVNACAQDLEKDYPDLIVDTLAYHYTQKPPQKARPRANVAVRLCDIHCSFSVPLSDPRNREFTDDLVGWSKICNRLYIWDYVGNFNYPLLPHPNLRSMAPNVRFLIEHGVKGMFAEAPTFSGEAMSPLRNWLIAKLYWDPSRDPGKLMQQFCDGYFGAGGKDVLAYIDTIQDAVEASGDSLGLSSPSDAKFLSYQTLGKGWLQLQNAERAVANDPELKRRVRSEEIAVLYAVISNWQRCHEQAKGAKEAWPWSAKLGAAIGDLRNRAGEQGISLSGVPLPADSGK